jgi:hypothetical protein
MPSSKDRIYILLSGLIVVGYSWIIVNSIIGQEAKRIVCPIKMSTGIPCPSCGSTRSVLMLIEGDLHLALYTNPFGLLIFAVLLIGPFWILYDYLLKKDTLWIFYYKVETILKNKKIALPLILLVIINWIWNISKEL